VLTKTRQPELSRYRTTRDRAANVRVFRLTAEVLHAMETGVSSHPNGEWSAKCRAWGQAAVRGRGKGGPRSSPPWRGSAQFAWQLPGQDGRPRTPPARGGAPFSREVNPPPPACAGNDPSRSPAAAPARESGYGRSTWPETT
jgi:hypothetical protein